MQVFLRFAVWCSMLAGLAAPAFARGDYQNYSELSLVEGIRVSVDDQMADGCLAQPDVLRTEAERTIRHAGITVSDWAAYYLLLELLGGYGQTGACGGHLKVELSRFVMTREGHIAIGLAYTRAYMATGYSKQAMQAFLREKVSEAVTDLANEILQMREIKSD